MSTETFASWLGFTPAQGEASDISAAYYSGGGAAAVNAVKDNAKELYNNLAGAFMVGQDGLTTTPGFSVTTSNNGATSGSPNG